MWISATSFLTPTVLLFCVLNLTIFTIFITSVLKKLQKLSDDHEQDNSPQQLIRVPLLLKQVKSISLFNYRSEQPDQFETASHSTTSPPPPEEPTHQQESECVEESHLTRSRSDTRVQAPTKRVLKKSASEEVHVDEPEEEEDRRRPATVKETPLLVRVPLLLKRVKSISLFNYRSEQPNQFETATHPTTSPPPPEEPTHQQESECVEESHVTRSKSDTSMQAPTKRVLKKSASEKVYVAESEEEEEEDEDRRRPATVKETAPSNWAEDETVDSKADDFIDNFRQQLKLQRSSSITRYNEMLNRGLRD